MATYYRWDKYNVTYSEEITSDKGGSYRYGVQTFDSIQVEYEYSSNAYRIKDGHFEIYDPVTQTFYPGDSNLGIGSDDNNAYLYIPELNRDVLFSGFLSVYFEENKDVQVKGRYPASDFNIHRIKPVKGSRVGYVYSTSSSAYPNGGVQDGYYYDQRTTVTSPTAPTNLTYPATITTPTVEISWTAATSNTSYPVDHYSLTCDPDGGVNYNTVIAENIPAGTTSYTYTIPAGTTSIAFAVRAFDSNGAASSPTFGPASTVLLAPTLTVPQMVMQGQQATISWSAIEGADSYTLQRKSSADADWTQVYSGANQSYTETVGTWTSLQYRVQAVFDGTPGGWATSDPIQIVSASALVISGQDGDLGTLVNDVQYSISSDQTSPTIDVTVEVNGGEYTSFQATSGQTYKVGVLDLPTGTGSIVITATTEVSSSPVTVTRTWTYSKTAASFPNNGSVARLTQEGATVYPETLAEAVRTAMTPWGGNLSTVLDLLSRAALYSGTSQAKYSEVTVSLAGKTEGQTIQLPENGKMVEFYVAKLDYESALNGAGRVLLVRKDCYDKRAWDAGNVNAWASSDLLTWLNGTYKALFPEEIQTAMGTTTYYYTPADGNFSVTTRSDAVFSLSATELGLSQTLFNAEGSTLSISNTLKIAYLNGNANDQWTRTPHTSTGTHAIFLNTSGSVGNGACNYSAGSRPCFTFPSTFSYGPVYVAQDGTIHPSQEYTEAGDWLDVWGNAIPAVKIETGSYVGTGTSGSGNPNTLTFPFEPKFVVILRGSGSTSPSYNAGDPKNAPLFMARGINGITQQGGSSAAYWGYNSAEWDGNSVKWYSNDASKQKNLSDSTYYYVAIG